MLNNTFIIRSDFTSGARTEPEVTRKDTYSEAMLISGASKQISCAIFIFYSIFKSTADTANRVGYIVRIITPYSSFNDQL